MKEKTVSPQRGHLISVIVPVYKVEPYLRCCIDSILAQTFTDFELILVDDGSPDNCGAICDEYAAKDDRIIVIHQQNGGLSAARNTGIDWVFANSKSEWIAFVDSDDVIHATYLEYLYNAALKSGAGLSAVYPKYFYYEEEIKDYCPSVSKQEIISSRDACQRMYSGDDMYLLSAWGKIYRKKLFVIYRFPVGKIYEDQYLGPKLLYDSEKVSILHSRLYYYRQRTGSIINSAFSLKRFDMIYAFDSCIQFFKAHNEPELVNLVSRQKKIQLADVTIKAWEKGLGKSIPPTYKMPLWKAYWDIFEDTIRRGGIKFVFVRIGNMFKRFSRK